MYLLWWRRFARQYFPVVSANCFRTSDGRWVQLLGVDLPRHLPKLARVLGIQMSLYPRCACTHQCPPSSSLVSLVVKWLKHCVCCCSLLATLACKVLPKVGPRLLKFPPLFLCLNTAISAAIANLSWSELTTLFQQHDVWYCPVNTPASALRFQQAQECQIFEAHTTQLGEGVRVSSPISLSGVPVAQRLPAPPRLGSKIN